MTGMTHLKRRDLLLWPLAAGLAPPGWAQDAPDPNAWLEAVQDGKALGCVNDRNGEALALMSGEPDFARRRKETLAAVVRPFTRSLSSSFRIAPAPRKPMPAKRPCSTHAC